MLPRTIVTQRLRTHVYTAGSPENRPVVLLHGNVSSAEFFERFGARLAVDHYVIAPDLRGYGGSEPKPVDAVRGLRDFADDVEELLADAALGLGNRPAHFVGWSVGGNVAMQMAIDYGARVSSLTLLNPSSPYGFGGTRGLDGTPCHADFSGSGGGTANPEFVRRLASGDTTDDAPISPRSVLDNFYWKPPFMPEPAREERYLNAMLQTHTGEANYPGDMKTSANWPGVAPGTTGMNNALSPKYMNQSGFATLDRKPPVLWLRGADDLIVSDRSMFDFGVLGELGAVPDWPGVDVFPAQPMVSQMRAVLDAYQRGGGRYREQVIADCGHAPHIEREDETYTHLCAFLAEAER